MVKANEQSGPATLLVRVRALAADAGFDLCGVVDLTGDLPELAYFKQWIAQGHHGEMAYLASRNEAGELKRAGVTNAAPWAKSAVVCAMNYNSAAPYSTEVKDASRGWISRYGWFKDHRDKGSDYHDAVLARLRGFEATFRTRFADQSPNAPLRTWCYVDTGPVVERVLAKHAAIGWQAKNTCIIHEELGSWLFLAVMLTSMDVGSEALPLPAADRCGSCTRCIDACPTSAIIAPYKLDARRCISYLTIEKRGELPLEFLPQMGHQVFGCDICQDVCPWNGAESLHKRAPVAENPDLQVRPELVHPELAWLERLTATAESFNAAFRGSPIKRAKREGLRRNVAIAMGNSGDKNFLPPLEVMKKDPDPAVRSAAEWAISCLHAPSA